MNTVSVVCQPETNVTDAAYHPCRLQNILVHNQQEDLEVIAPMTWILMADWAPKQIKQALSQSYKYFKELGAL